MNASRNNLIRECERAVRALRRDGNAGSGTARVFKHTRRAVGFPLMYARYLLAHAGVLGGADTVVPTFWGQRMVVPLSDGDATGVAFWGILAGPEYKLIQYFIRSLPHDAIFYDIGANHGFYSMLAQELVSEGEVHAFEPLSSVYSYLARNASGATLNKSALTDRIGMVPMFDMTHAGHSGGSTIEQAVGARMKTAHTTSVPATTLDEYCRTHTPPTVMKIDVEGGEHLVLEGGRATIEKYRPVIAMEVWGGEKGRQFSASALEELQGLGYRGYHIEEDGSLSSHRLPVDFIGIAESDNLIFKNDG